MAKEKTVLLTDMDTFFIHTMLKDAMNRAMDKGDVYAMRMCCDLWEKVAQ